MAAAGRSLRYNPRTMRPLAALLCAILAISTLSAQKKKKEEETQTLRLPEELPNAVVGETGRLAFHTTPLSAKGLLSPQVRDALKALQHEAGGETVLKIRVFVAGTGDLRHVRDLVSEFYTAHKQPLPTVTMVKVGALPLEGAQVEFEAIAETKKDVNPAGLAFVSPAIATAEDPLGPVQPLVQKSLAGLRESLAAAKLAPADVARLTCFVSSLAGLAETRSLVDAEYPHAALDYVQPARAPREALAACEAVARLHAAPAQPVEFIGTAGGESQSALIGAAQVVLTGSQYSFGYQESDGRLAFERLKKSLEQAGANPANVAFAHYYPLSQTLAAEIRKVRTGFFHNPAATTLLFEGLPSMDAGFGVDVVAVK
jgi:enamine deaminase RidA (YjgF/YER057c/UK114 family)